MARALAIAVALCCCGGARHAPRSAPRRRSQRAQLESGTAILRLAEVDARAGARRRSRRSLAGLTPRFFEALPMVAVRGSAAALRAAARRPGVVAAHSDRRLSYELYQATPLVFGGQHEEMAAAGSTAAG